MKVHNKANGIVNVDMAKATELERMDPCSYILRQPCDSGRLKLYFSDEG
jgi:hypothetical protein